MFRQIREGSIALIVCERAPEFNLSIIYLLTKYWSYEIKKKRFGFIPSTVKRRHAFLGEFKRKICNNASIMQAYNMHKLGLK